MAELTENEVVNLPCSVPRYIKSALYERVEPMKRSKFIAAALAKELGLKYNND